MPDDEKLYDLFVTESQFVKDSDKVIWESWPYGDPTNSKKFGFMVGDVAHSYSIAESNASDLHLGSVFASGAGI